MLLVVSSGGGVVVVVVGGGGSAEVERAAAFRAEIHTKTLVYSPEYLFKVTI